MKAGEVMGCDVYHDPQWRCLVAGCPDYGHWHIGPWPEQALSAHYRIHHQVQP